MAGELHVFSTSRSLYTNPDTKPYKVRKTHTKSRYGCKTCKLRRTKCDERHPTCSACLRKSLPCAYPDNVRQHDPYPAPSSQLSWPGTKSPLILTTSTNGFSSNNDLSMLHHFVTYTSRDFFDPRAMYGSQSIEIMPLATTNAHIMHAILAAAALHLRFTTCTGRQYHELETGHWLSASSSFRSALTKYDSTTNPDPLLTTCMLLNLLAFANIGPREHAMGRDRWPFRTTQPQDLQWISVQLGLSPLLAGLSSHAKGDSIWLPLFLATGTSDLYDDRDGIIDVPPAYQSFFDIDETSICDGEHRNIARHPYLRLVRRVLTIGRLWAAAQTQEQHDLNCIKYLQFMQAVDSEVVKKMEERDLKTLLLYAMWMGICCGVQLWWCRGRAESECLAVVRWLDAEHGEWLSGWLEEPAVAVGYRVKNKG